MCFRAHYTHRTHRTQPHDDASNLILQNGKIQIKHSQFGYGNSERPVIVTNNEVLKLYNFIIILVGLSRLWVFTVHRSP